MMHFLSALFFTLAIFFSSGSLRGAPPQFDPVLIPPQQLEHFTFGFSELIADVLWLRSIQSLDYCGQSFTTDEEVQVGSQMMKVCQQGWVFQMLDAATRVSPRYRIIYSRGAVSLSVIVNDRLGALALFERGAKTYQDDWVIRYYTGYHKLLEMKDVAGAAEEMRVAAQLGAPSWLTLLAARLFSEAGQAEFGLQALASFYGSEPFSEWPERAQERWHELEKKLGKTITPTFPKSK